MYISFKSHEDAINQANEDAQRLKSFINSALSSGLREIIINNNAKYYREMDESHPYITYLETLCGNFEGAYWKIEERKDSICVSLTWEDSFQLKAA